MSEDDEPEFHDDVDDDDEDDIPLSKLTKKSGSGGTNGGRSATTKNGGDNDGDRKRRASRGSVSYKEDHDEDEDDEDGEEYEEGDAEGFEEVEEPDEVGDSDDDDDDVPLASLKSPPKKKAKKVEKKKSKATTKTNGSSSSSSSTKAKPNLNSNFTKYTTQSSALYDCKCKKGLLIQKLLCRWWYAMTWPDPSTLPARPPENYDKMDGFPGVYVCTAGDEVGTIKDLRDKDKAPCFENFSKTPSEELKVLLVKALTEQKRQLVQAEGAGTYLEKELNAEIKWAEKIDGRKADNEAVKIIKAYKLDK